jgi:hypothetical protein
MANISLVRRISTGCLVAALTCISLPTLAAEQPAEPKWTETVAGKKTDTTSENDSAATQDASIEVNRVSKNIQQLKQQVIDLNKDLRLMEEKLLFPSSTKYSVFVSMSSGQFFSLESIKLKLDGKLVATHIYSEKQRQALIRGGIHKFYITNLNEGQHTATIFFTGVGPNGRAYKRASTIDFEKGPAGEYLEVAISDDSVTQEPVFGIKQW